ncbi:DUF4303 domain-containing protein, partial [Streptomyces anthocyanicus]|uniref:DUF4303 domain-containing protein n=1 Tax=Streptomyces anthocyanicus TaxID=68174 RepID=UPI0033AB04D5
MQPTESELADAVHRAARAALLDLFREHPDHRFYYCTLVTSGGVPLCPSSRRPCRVWGDSVLLGSCRELDARG